MLSISKKHKTLNEIKKIKTNQCKIYIENGFAIIPLEPNKKRPYISLLKHFYGDSKWKPFTKRKAAFFEIEQWIEKFPYLNIGIITGKISGLIAIDIDHFQNKKGKKIIEISSKIKTPEVTTGRGKHLYFRTKKQIKSTDIKSPEGEKIGEISGEGRYIVAPPSNHPSGEVYSWKKQKSIIQQNMMYYNEIQIQEKSKENLLLLNTKTSKKYYDFKKPIKKDSKKDITPSKEYNRWWHQLQRDEDIAKKIMSLAGVKIEKLGQSFSCPFHEDDHPSASLYMIEKTNLEKNKHSYIAFADFHNKGRPLWFDPKKDTDKYLKPNGSKQQWFNLGEVFFAIHTGKELQKLAKGVGVMWWLRALDEIGEMKTLPSISSKKLPEPDENNYYSVKTKSSKKNYRIQAKTVDKVYDGFQYLLQLKIIYDEKQMGTTFSYRFAADWCNLSKTSVRKAMVFLMRNNYISVTKRTKGNKANILDIQR